jgi:hypothetical protein
MNSSGDITIWVVPSRVGVFRVSTTCPARLPFIGNGGADNVAAPARRALPEERPMPRKPNASPVYFLVALLAATLLAGALLTLPLAS